jgi:glutamate-1-semialdehyde 2,1-aminomutase
MFRLHMKATVPANYREAYTNVDENRRLKMMLEHLFAEGFLLVGTCTGMLSTPMTEADIDALVGAIETGLKKIS